MDSAAARQRFTVKPFDTATIRSFYEQLDADKYEVLRDVIRHSGWHINVQRAAFVLVDLAERTGRVMQMSGAALGAALRMSPSSGSRYFRKLREVGFLQLAKRHKVIAVKNGYFGVAAVNVLRSLEEQSLYRSKAFLTRLNEGLRRRSLREGGLREENGSGSALTCDDDQKTRMPSQDGKVRGSVGPASGGPSLTRPASGRTLTPLTFRLRGHDWLASLAGEAWSSRSLRPGVGVVLLLPRNPG